MLVVMDYV
ncbi:Protein of unknown function [Streptococcus thermophilus]|nr:Protein of unknown function [Streptococcus thermophilus]